MTKADIHASFATRQLTIEITAGRTVYRLHVDPIGHMGIIPEECSFKVTKSRNLVVVLRKVNPGLKFETTLRHAEKFR